MDIAHGALAQAGGEEGLVSLKANAADEFGVEGGAGVIGGGVAGGAARGELKLVFLEGVSGEVQCRG